MTSSDDTGPSPDATGRAQLPDDASPEELQADIEQTRAELGDTVEALAGKLDVKAQAEEQVQAVKDSATARYESAQSWVKDRSARAKHAATDEQGKPTPQVIAIGAAAALVVALVVGGVAQRRTIARRGNRALAKGHARQAERRARKAVGHL